MHEREESLGPREGSPELCIHLVGAQEKATSVSPSRLGCCLADIPEKSLPTFLRQRKSLTFVSYFHFLKPNGLEMMNVGICLVFLD